MALKDASCQATTMSGFFTEAEVVLRKRTPKRIGCYMMGARLGRGSFAKVAEAYHVESLERVAIKIINLQRLRKKMMGGPSTYPDEINLLNSLNHPRIVRFIDSFEDLRRGKVYITLEYMSGGDLQHLVDARKLSLQETRGVFRSLIEGLAYLHRMGIVHQDIKPSNLLINSIGAVKISDFGVAQHVQPREAPHETSIHLPDISSGDSSSSSSSSSSSYSSSS